MLWIVLVSAISVAVGCPKDVMRQVKQCMGPLEVYSVDQGGIFMLMSSLDKTSQLCSEGKIQNAFACLNNLYNKCAKSKEGMHHFDLMVDVGKWRHAMDNICNNIHYLQDHNDCEAQAYLEYKPCADEKVALFNHQMASVWADMGSTGHVSDEQKTEAMMDVGCSFTVNILDCLRTPFTKYCPKQLTNLLVNTVEDFMPPACIKRALINSINKIPRYKHINPEKAHAYNNNSNSSTNVINEVIIASSTTPIVNVEVLIENPNDMSQNDVKIPIPSPEAADATNEAVGSARFSEDITENFSFRPSLDIYVTIVSLTATILWKTV